MNPTVYSAYSELANDVKQVLYSPEDLQQRVQELGRQISQDYSGKNILVVGVLKSVMCFMADLIRSITIPLEVDFISIMGYSSNKQAFRGVVRIEKDLALTAEGRHVLFVEDVVDTGLTLNYLLRNLKARRPASLEVCALFDKPTRRLIDQPIKYAGFNLPDYFVVGYGLDYHERYRNLPFVGVLKPNIIFGEKGE